MLNPLHRQTRPWPRRCWPHASRSACSPRMSCSWRLSWAPCSRSASCLSASLHGRPPGKLTHSTICTCLAQCLSPWVAGPIALCSGDAGEHAHALRRYHDHRSLLLGAASLYYAAVIVTCSLVPSMQPQDASSTWSIGTVLVAALCTTATAVLGAVRLGLVALTSPYA